MDNHRGTRSTTCSRHGDVDTVHLCGLLIAGLPQAPLLALLNNLLELRTDAFKLCHVRHSPLAHKTSGISVWLSELLVMSVMAVMVVLTNCFHLHLAYSTERVLPSVSATVGITYQHTAIGQQVLCGCT
jgi:hypothetical protein